MLEIIAVIWINVLLSGDNVLLIGLLSRNLSPQDRRIAMYAGTASAILCRIVLTILAMKLLATPYVSLIGGLVLCFVAVKLVVAKDGHDGTRSPSGLWAAIRLIAIGDLVMSLDNVLAVAAVAHQHILPIVIGLLCMIPIMLVGTKFIVWVSETFPFIVHIGALYLGWIAAEMIMNDPTITFDTNQVRYVFQAIITSIVLCIAIIWQRRMVK